MHNLHIHILIERKQSIYMHFSTAVTFYPLSSLIPQHLFSSGSSATVRNRLCQLKSFLIYAVVLPHTQYNYIKCMPNTSKNFWNLTIDLYAFTIVSKLKASLLSLLRTSSHKLVYLWHKERITSRP